MKIILNRKITSNFTTEDETDVVVLPGEYVINDEKVERLDLHERFKKVPQWITIVQLLGPIVENIIVDYSKLNKTKLQALLTERGIDFEAENTKAELIELLKVNEEIEEE